jgi:hypothetical protein
MACAWLSAVALWLILPLTSRLATYIPGTLAGDNVAFLWNVWWFRHSLAAHDPSLWTNELFAPWGTSLVLHTHTLLESAIGAALFPSASAVVAHNLMLIAGLAANGIAVYALAFHYTRRPMPSLIAGTIFSWSSFVAVHLAGHFNLVHAWVLPLAVWCGVRALERASRARMMAAATALAAVAYSDYYYTVYAVGILTLIALSRQWTLRSERRQPTPAAAVMLLCGAMIAAIAGVAVVWTGGGSFEIASWTISLRSTRNPVMTASVLMMAAWLAAFRVRLVPLDPQPSGPSSREWAIAGLVVAVLVSPLAIGATRLAAAGGYAAQPVLWRSSPPGIDLATLVEGPPRHVILGERVDAAYRSGHIDTIEQCGWLGLVSMFGVGLALVGYRREPDVRTWLVVAGVFFLIALGPFVRVAGVDTGVPGPFALLRYVPILSNARMPARAIVVVQLAAAVLTAMVLARRGGRTREGLAWLLVLVVETIPRPSPLYALPQRDMVDAALRQSSQPGSVIELPTGLRDGFGVIGRLDHRALVHQMEHGRPLVGGFVARVSPVLRASYLATPFLTKALGLSAENASPDVRLDAASAANLGIGFLVVNRDSLGPVIPVTRPALEASGWRFVTADGDRELYAVRAGRSP